MNRVNRYAFTLVELLVVIAIIGILVALMLPAIQASRESARRVMCTNNLSQLILGVHEYEAAHEVYPMGTANNQGPINNVPVGHHINWIAHVLPYIDESALYENVDLSLSAYHQKNDRARQTTIRLLLCPSISTTDWPFSSYAGCHHDVEAPIDVNNRGVFFLNSQITRNDLKDGAGYTILLGEKLPDDFDLGWISGTPSTLRNTGSPLNGGRVRGSAAMPPPWIYSYAQPDGEWQWSNPPEAAGDMDPAVEPGEAAAEQSGTADNSDVKSDDAKAAPASDEKATPALQSKPVVAEATNPSPAAAAPADPELTPDKNGILPHSKLGGNPAKPLIVGGFASEHVAGVNFAFGDGSVRFITDDASASLMGRLANRADGQIIDGKEL